MSKIKSELVMPLQEIAENLGFSTIQDALDNGYHVVEDLTTGTATLKKLDEQELAHEAWLKEKKEILDGLDHIEISYRKVLEDDVEYINRAVEFIKGVKYE